MDSKKEVRILLSFGAISAVAIILLSLRFIFSDSFDYWFLSWNLLLAWLPLLLALKVSKIKFSKNKPIFLILLFLWLVFLPNSFYLITDFKHFYAGVDKYMMFDIVLLFFYSFVGFLLGYVSIYLIQTKISATIGPRKASKFVLVSIFLSSFAIYLGRFLRWNTWDIVLHPVQISIDVLDIALHPHKHQDVFLLTLLLFATIASLYFSLIYLSKILKTIDIN